MLDLTVTLRSVRHLHVGHFCFSWTSRYVRRFRLYAVNDPYLYGLTTYQEVVKGKITDGLWTFEDILKLHSR